MQIMLRTLLLSAWILFHPVHVTLTSIDWVPESDLFKVFIRVYYDDFLLDYKLNGSEIPNIDFSGNNSGAKNVMEKYLGDKVILKVNEKQLSGKLQNIDLTDNEISMNLEYHSDKKPDFVTVKNLIMTALYPDQSNMIIVKVFDFEEGAKLTTDETERTFIIK